MPEYSAGKMTDYADGDRRVVDCAESEVGIFRIDGEFFACSA
jgi:nitrite reductase (NADH) small subunit